MAYRNIQKYKKHYLFVFFVILFLSIFFMSYSIIWDNHYEVVKKYNQTQYGYWYAMMHIDDSYREDVEQYIRTYENDTQYGYYYNQGVYNNGKIGYVDQKAMKLCHLQIIQGHYPQNSDEIMISTDLFHQFKLNQTIELKVQNQKKQNYKIVGVVENSQEELFPCIYTYYNYGETCWIVADRELGFDGHITLDNDAQLYFNDLMINEYGYSSNQVAAKYILSIQQIIVLTEILILAIFVLIALGFTSLKRRSKELALLRGIGMTTRQLFLMVIYENIFTTLVALVIGVILSLGISYGVMLYFENQYGYFIYHIDIIKVITYALLLLICVIISMIYPIMTSAKQSLSGAFEGQTFKHRQVRYHHLKYQKKWRLALREMYVYKKLPICLFCIFGLLIVYYTGTFVKPEEKVVPRFKSLHYIEYQTDDEDEIQTIVNLQMPHTIAFRYMELSGITVDSITKEIVETHIRWNDNNEMISTSGAFYCIDNQEWLNHSEVNGNFPQNDNELLLGMVTNIAGIKDFYEIDNTLNTEVYDVGNLSVGDTLYIDGKDYHIVGNIIPSEQVKLNGMMESIYFLPTESVSIYVSPQTYETWLRVFQDNISKTGKTLRTYYESDKEKEKYIQQVHSVLPNMEIIDSDAALLNSQGKDVLVDIEPSMLILPVIVSLIFCYYLNKNQMMNDSQDYGLYKLIGMTNKELIIKQFYKAIIMTIGIFVFELIWIIIFNTYYQLLIIPIKECILSIVAVFIMTSFIYCVPLYHMLKDDFILSLKGQE